jgi:hypothetical protein
LMLAGFVAVPLASAHLWFLARPVAAPLPWTEPHRPFDVRTGLRPSQLLHARCRSPSGAGWVAAPSRDRHRLADGWVCGPAPEG